LECWNVIDSVDRRRVLAEWAVTLTSVVGEISWTEHEVVRKRYAERLRRRWGNRLTAIWTREPHPRSGFPHMHCVFFWVADPPSLAEFKAWNDRAWAESVGKSVEKVMKCGCRVEPVISVGGFAVYLSKYVSKMPGPDDVAVESEHGKSWGYFNKKLLPLDITDVVEPPAVGKLYLRTLRRLEQRKRRVWQYRGVGAKSGKTFWGPIHECMREFPGPRASVPGIKAMFREMGWTIRYKKYRVMRRRIVSEQLGKGEYLLDGGEFGARELAFMKNGGYKLVSRPCSCFRMDTAQALRLLQWCRNTC